MTELEKFQLVNSCETSQELADAIIKMADPETGEIKGRTRSFDAKRMSNNVFGVINGHYEFNVLTREWGIRQQAMYLIHYEKH